MTRTGSWAVALAAGILALDIGAFAQTQHGTQPTSEMSQTTRSEAKDKAATTRYIQAAMMSGLFEVEAGKLALTKARANAVKDFARMMVNDHTEWNKKLEDAVAQGKVATKPPAKLDAEHQKKLDRLKNANTAQFDRLFMDTQVKGHNQALALHKGYAAHGDADALKTLAGELVPMVQHHLDMANKVASGISSPSATNSNRTTGMPRKGS